MWLFEHHFRHLSQRKLEAHRLWQEVEYETELKTEALQRQSDLNPSSNPLWIQRSHWDVWDPLCQRAKRVSNLWRFNNRGIRVPNRPWLLSCWLAVFAFFKAQMKVRLVFLLYGYQFSTLKPVYHIWLYEPHFHPVAQKEGGGGREKHPLIVVPLSHRASDVVHI